jgi:glycosyltransferase involved in cell wall biosynthesis
MRILFASGVEGGSFRSTLELARALHHRGHDVICLVTQTGHERDRRLYKRLVNLRTKLGNDRVGGRAVDAIARRVGARVTARPGSEPRVVMAPVIENAVPALMAAQDSDIVVAASLERVAWRSILLHARRVQTPAALYLREMVATGHLTITKMPPDLLLANAGSLAEGARHAGHTAHVVPSVVDLSRSRVASTREIALYVNPIVSHGLDLALALADQCPDIEFLFQQSWDIAPETLAALSADVARRDNVVFRAPVDTSAEVYARARVLLVPYLDENRPRVILEAMDNGLPVLIADRPGLKEVAGPAGIVLPSNEPGAWAAELRRLWTDRAYYEEMSRRSSARSMSPDVAADAIVEKFESLVCRAIETSSSLRGDRL